MMDQLIARLNEAQVNIQVVDGNLKLRARQGSIPDDLLREIKTNKEALMLYLKQEPTPKALSKIHAGESYYELSLFQQELWINAELYQSNFYNQIRPFSIDGPMDLAAFEKAAEDLIDRYEILRTTFHLLENIPHQKVEQRSSLFEKVLEYQSIAGVENAFDQAIDQIKKAGKTSYDLSKGPLIRFLLFKVAPERYVFALLSHHIIMDGWSSGIITEYLVSRYLHYTEGRASEFAPLNFQYKEFAAAQNQQLKTGQLNLHRNFWMQYLAGEIPQLNLQSDYIRPAVKTFRGDGVIELMDARMTNRLKDYCKKNGISPFIFFQVLVKTLLYRYTGQQDIIIGAVFAGRETVEMEKQVGSFANILPVRTRLNGSDSFKKVVNQVRQQILEIFKHQFYPFSQILKDLDLPFDNSHSPLFDVTVIVQNFQEQGHQPADFGKIQINPLDFENTLTTQDLSLIITEKTNNQIELAVFYQSDIFRKERIKTLSQHLKNLLDAVLTDDEKSISSINFLSGQERFELLQTFNDTSIGDPGYESILDLFQEIVHKYRDHAALVSGNHQLSYRQLDEQSDNLAALLGHTHGIRPGDFVGVFTGRNHYTIISLLSILKLGAIYLPIDEDLPENRIQEMCRLTEAKLIVTTSDLFSRMDAGFPCSTLLIAPSILETKSESPWTSHPVKASDPAYIVFTSGSTGTPKPIVARHEGLINNVCDYMPKLGVKPEDNYLQFFATGFDGFFFDIFPLLAGATLVMVENDTIKDKSKFLQYLETHQVTMTAMTPSYLDVLEKHELPTLKTLISAGEAVDPQTARYYAARKRFFNLYGPAETTVIASFYEVDPQINYQTIPIGKPCANKLLYVLDDALNLLPKGTPGELCISGAGIVEGYFKSPAQTTDKFVPNPFAKGKMLYKTGDLAMWTDAGDLLFLGRKDGQVKINGHRVEPGEIEQVLLAHESIAKAVVLAAEKRSELFAFYQTTEAPPNNTAQKSALSPVSLREYLSQRIPVYMIPGKFVEITDWPVTPQGKTDHKKLMQVAEMTRVEVGTAHPENELQANIQQIWKQLLHRDAIGIHDHFFQIGGDSLLAIRAISMLRNALQLELSVRDLLYHPTIEGLAKFIEETAKTENTLPPLLAGERPEKIPLSYSQERLWVIDQVDGSIQYHIPALLRIKNALDKTLLETAFRALMARHEVLRTVFQADEGRPWQVILTPDAWHLDDHDDEVFSDAAYLKTFIQNEISQPFDLSKDYMLRARLVKCGADEHVLLLVIHHIAADGWSLSLLIDDLAELYNALQGKRVSKLTKLPVQYADYAIWQQKHLNAGVLSNQLGWWENQLRGIEPLMLPADYQRPPVQSIRGARFEFGLDKALTSDLKALSLARGATLFMTLIAAFKVLLYRYSGQKDIVVGTPVSNRRHQELESLAGFFINTLVLRSDLNGNPGFNALLEQVKSVVLAGFAHQEVPFEQIVDRVEKNRSLSRNPLFQVEFVMQNTPEMRKLNLGALSLSEESMEQETAQFDLSFSVMETEDGLQIGINYCRDIFSRSRIERMAGHYACLLEAIAANPELPIDQLRLLTSKEEKQILNEFNDTFVAYPAEKTFVDLFEAQVLQTPDHMAVTCEGVGLSYRELDTQATQLSLYLQQTGLVREGIIGVCMDRSIAMLISLLGILKAGGTYLPVDPDYPEDRIRYILEDSAASLVITDRSKVELLRHAGDFNFLLMDGDWIAEIPSKKTSKDRVNPPDLAYVIYTSGSTGNPKGALIEHRGMLNHLFAKVNELQISAESKVLQNASQSFDISIWQFLVALLRGGTTVIYPQDLVMNSSQFIQRILADRLTHVEVVPSYLRLLLEEQKLLQLQLPELQYLLVTGEILPKQLISGWFAAFPDIPMVNAYGPTEASDDITHCFFTKAPDNDLVPIGHTLQNLNIYVVNKQMALCPIGVPGEIVVSGIGVGRGYLNNPTLTAEKFISNPFQADGRIYKTGDTGYWLENGELAFLGRMDNQVKIRGHRIELGEIEAVLQQAPGVREGVVLVREDSNHNKQLVAYVVAESAEGRAGIQAYLQSRLPDYMAPAIIVQLDQMPLTPNGKIDRKALPAVDETLSGARNFMAPSNETEQQLAIIWASLLGKEKISVDDNFFEMGGDSIITIQVVSRAKRMGYQLQPRDLFLSPTISALAKIIEGNTQQHTLNEQGLLEGESGLSPIQASFFENEHSEMAHYNQSILLEISKDIPEDHLRQTIEAMVRHHDALRFAYRKENGVWRQQYGKSAGQFETADLLSCAPEFLGAEITRHCALHQSSLRLESGALLRAVLIQTPSFEKNNRLFMVVHHLAIDGVSWRILMENLESALAALAEGAPINLGSKGTSYRQWVEALEKYAASHRAAIQIPYWESIMAAYQPLPVDKHSPPSTFSDIESHEAHLEAGLTHSLLQEVNPVYHTEINDLLLAALALTIGRWSGFEKVMIGLEGHGREDIFPQIDIGNLVGWFTSLYPVSLNIESQVDEGHLIKSVKEQLRAIPEKGIGYGILRYLHPSSGVRKKLSAGNWDIVFNYLGQLDNLVASNSLLQMAEESEGKSKSDHYPVKEKIAINAFVSAGKLTLSWNYSTKQYEKTTIENLATAYMKNLSRLILHCLAKEHQEFTPSDHGLSGDISYSEFDHLNAILAEEEVDGDEILKF